MTKYRHLTDEELVGAAEAALINSNNDLYVELLLRLKKRIDEE